MGRAGDDPGQNRRVVLEASAIGSSIEDTITVEEMPLATCVSTVVSRPASQGNAVAVTFPANAAPTQSVTPRRVSPLTIAMPPTTRNSTFHDTPS